VERFRSLSSRHPIKPAALKASTIINACMNFSSALNLAGFNSSHFGSSDPH
jgi:hypothetical protein